MAHAPTTPWADVDEETWDTIIGESFETDPYLNNDIETARGALEEAHVTHRLVYRRHGQSTYVGFKTVSGVMFGRRVYYPTPR